VFRQLKKFKQLQFSFYYTIVSNTITIDSFCLFIVISKIIYCCLLLLFIHIGKCDAIFAQESSIEPLNKHAFEPEVLIDNYTQAQGLPIDGITSIMWGFDNWLYLTTFEGLARFNGSSFQVFNSVNDSVFTTDGIIKQFHSKKNGIWLIDGENELMYWEPKKGIRIERKQGLPNIMVHDIVEDEQESIWLGTEYGIFKMNENFTFKQFNRDLRLVVWNLIPIDAHSTLAMTNHGLFFVSEFQLFNLLNANDPLIRKDSRVRFQKTKKGEYILSTTNGIIHFDKDFKELFRKDLDLMVYHTLTLNEVNESYLLRTVGEMYIYTPKKKKVEKYSSAFNLFGGTYRKFDLYWQDSILLVDDNEIFHKGRKIFETPNNSLIIDIKQDNVGNLWVATNGDGLFKIRYSKFQTIDQRDGIPALNTYSMREASGNRIFFTTLIQGLLEWNGHQLIKHRANTEGPTSRIDARTVTISRDNVIYVSFWAGGMWSNKTKKWERIFPKDHILSRHNNVIEAIYEDNKERLWLGSLSGLYVYDKITGKTIEIRDSLGFPIIKVRHIQQFDDQHLIAGTNGNGVFKFNISNLYAFSEPTQITGKSIRDIYIQNDTIWYATEDKGLIRAVYNKNKELNTAIFHYPKIKKDWAVHRILTDRFGFWWLTNNQGLYRIKKSELDLFLDNKIAETKVDYFTEKNGLPYREFNGGVQSAGFSDGQGNLWLPGIRGISYLQPSHFLKVDSLNPELLITHYETNLATHEIFNNLEPIHLSKEERTISIHFDVLDFSNPDQLTFSYATDTNPSIWIDLQNKRSFTLSNLVSGSHHINIKVNHRFSYQPSIIAFDFDVESNFYETALFYTLVFLVFVGLISVVFFIIIQRNKKTEIRLKKRIDDRSVELIQKQKETDSILRIVQQQRDELDQMNKNQIENFHTFSHKIRTPLQMIRGPVELIITTLKEQGKLDAKTSKSLHLLEKYNQELLNYSDKLLHVITDNYQFAQDTEEFNEPIVSESIQLSETSENKSEESHLIKLLIIDDIEDIRDYLSLSLNNDFNLKTASGGNEAFQILASFRPDVIISDVMMPEMDGLEFARKLYQTPGFEHVPLVFLTAKDSEKDRFMGLQSGAVAYITKPVNISILNAQVQALVKRELVIQSEKSSTSLKNVDSIFRKKVNELILRNISHPDLSLETLAEALHMSKSTLYRKWKEEDDDETLANYILSIRLAETLELVQEQSISFAEASSLCGFNNPSYFSRAFKKVYGCTPSEYIEKSN